jgi:16S rRNA (guanine527-N7)-methyltransferase
VKHSHEENAHRSTVPTLPLWLEPARVGLVGYAELLAGPGTERGLIGPREIPRLWDRHILNCAVVADPATGLIPAGCVVADVGSGAGLPGLVWALARPDISVVLVEPLLRRATFLTEAIIELGLTTRVQVVRARAEDLPGTPTWVGVDVVTARAVAPMDKLVGWTLPLARRGGTLLALKGASAQEEVDGAGAALAAAGVVEAEVVTLGAGVVDPLTTVVVARTSPAQ